MRNENLEFNQLRLRRLARRIGDRVFVQRSLESLLPMVIVPTTLLAFMTRFGWITPVFDNQENILFVTALAVGAVWFPAAVRAERKQASLVEGVARRTFVEGISVQGARLASLDLRSRDAHGANFSNSSLKDAHFFETDLTGAQLNETVLTGANLRRSLLVDASLCGASLQHTSLQGADLTGANLRGATLRGADLTRANLHRANLQFVDFTDANLDGAKLETADLRGVVLRGASWDQTTTWPQGYPLLALEQGRWTSALAKAESKFREVAPSRGLAGTGWATMARRGVLVTAVAIIAGVTFVNVQSADSPTIEANTAVQGSQEIRLTISAVGREGAAEITSKGLGDLPSQVSSVPFGKVINVTADRANPAHLKFSVTTENTEGDLVCEMRADGELLRAAVAPSGQKTVMCEFFLT